MLNKKKQGFSKSVNARMSVTYASSHLQACLTLLLIISYQSLIGL